jgi:hypothetical protein
MAGGPNLGARKAQLLLLVFPYRGLALMLLPGSTRLSDGNLPERRCSCAQPPRHLAYGQAGFVDVETTLQSSSMIQSVPKKRVRFSEQAPIVHTFVVRLWHRSPA